MGDIRMEHYTMTGAAKALGISRPTLYKHVNRDIGKYTADIGGKRVITLYGMGLLQEVVKANTVNANINFTTNTVDEDPRIGELQAEVVTLQNTVRGLQDKLLAAESRYMEAEGYARAMKDANDKAMQTIQTISAQRVSIWARLFPGKQQNQ